MLLFQLVVYNNLSAEAPSDSCASEIVLKGAKERERKKEMFIQMKM